MMSNPDDSGPIDFPPAPVAQAEAEAKPEPRKRGRPKKVTPAAATAHGRSYRVSLACPTPLRDRELVVQAETADEARAKFEAHNGICGSVHAYSVTEV
jgi:hypothetical protein